ncbi:MAG: histidine kinase N-terminal 7TM domain-containing protein, partial [Chloroflexota bacterium]
MSLDSYVLLLLGAAAISLALTLYVLRRRRNAVTWPLSLLLVAAATWSFFYGLELVLPGLTLMRLALILEYVGIATIPVFWFVFAARYAGRGAGLTRSRVGLLFIVPAITVALVATNNVHHLYYASVQTGMLEGKSFLIVAPGPFYWVHVFYSYVLLLAGALLMLRAVLGASGISRVRAGLLLGGVLLPFVVNVCYVLGARPYGFVDLTPVAFVITGIGFTLGAFTFSLFAITPIALDTLFDSIPDAVLVLDADGTVVNANPAARELLREGSALRPIQDRIESEQQSGVAFHSGKQEGDVQVGGRTYDTTITALIDRTGTKRGTLVVMRDISERKRAEAAIGASEQRFRSLFEQSRDAIYIGTPDGTILDVNEAWLNLFGYSREDLPSLNAVDLYANPDDRSEFFRRIMETGMVVD